VNKTFNTNVISRKTCIILFPIHSNWWRFSHGTGS